ncbi:hypothetical protein AVEN_1159-1, partial [Araneus ventricosus]
MKKKIDSTVRVISLHWSGKNCCGSWS